MKKLFLVCSLALVVFSCKKAESTHETQWSSNKKDSVVYVNYQKEDGSFANFYMNYLLFTTLFRQGGYSNVYNHYQQNPTTFVNQKKYSNYSSSNGFVSTSNRYSSAKNSYNNTSSYSSPSRSSSSSYKSSYSSPTRSYSSPSRSYSSPSRSYSSPSRGR